MESGKLTILPETIEWVWNYIGGLVWHTKVLGEEAIARAKRAGRSVVYPSDVQQCLPLALDEKWCKQFYEGCETGQEKAVVDAMQCLAAKRDEYVHIDRIQDMLLLDMLELQSVMEILKALQVVEQHPIKPQLYRFGQDIYRRYFRTKPTSYTRIPEETDILQYKGDQAEPAAYLDTEDDDADLLD
jgi:hypothetical protein